MEKFSEINSSPAKGQVAQAAPHPSSNPVQSNTNTNPLHFASQTAPAMVTAANTSAWLLNLKVKVSTLTGKEHLGVIYSYDQLSNTLILKSEATRKQSDGQARTPSPRGDQRFSFKIVKLNAIKAIVPVDPSQVAFNESRAQTNPIQAVLQNPGPNPIYVNLNSISHRQQKAFANAADTNKRTNRLAPENGQKLFDAFSKMFPCSWDKNDIIVLDEVRIKPPYHVSSCESLASGYDKTLDRVKKTLEAERKKLNLDSQESNSQTLQPQATIGTKTLITDPKKKP